jgi:hypothetical protein
MTTIAYPTKSLADAATTRDNINIYAYAAFAFSVVGSVALSVICAIAALALIKNEGEGRGQAIASLVISAGWVVLLLALHRAHAI